MTQTPRPQSNRSRGPSRDAATARQAPRALWLVAQAFLALLHNLFGAPEDVARQHTLTHKAYKLFIPWLRAGETLLRQLLVIEASFYGKPNTRPLLHSSRQRVRKLMHFTADEPEKWRVSFRCFIDRARTPRPKPLRAARQRLSRAERRSYEHFKPVTFHDAWPLAERYEALLRVFNDPCPYARRLARRLYAAPHRRDVMLQAPRGAPNLIGAPDYERVHAGAKSARFDST